MCSRNNGALFGALLIIIGVYILSSSLRLSFGFLPWLALGLALLFLFYNKRKTWALVLGIILVELSVYATFDGFDFIRLSHVVCFFIPGTIFMSMFLLKGRQGLIVPGSLLLWLGTGLALRNTAIFPKDAALLTICIGMAFITVYLLTSLRNARSYLYVGLIFCLIGAYSVVRPLTIGGMGKICWLAVALLCVALIFRRKKINKDDI